MRHLWCSPERNGREVNKQMAIQKRFDFKLALCTSGSDVASAVIAGRLAAQSVEHWDDGSWQWVIGGKRYQYAGNDS